MLVYYLVILIWESQRGLVTRSETMTNVEAQVLGEQIGMLITTTTASSISAIKFIFLLNGRILQTVPDSLELMWAF